MGGCVGSRRLLIAGVRSTSHALPASYCSSVPIYFRRFYTNQNADNPSKQKSAFSSVFSRANQVSLQKQLVILQKELEQLQQRLKFSSPPKTPVKISFALFLSFVAAGYYCYEDIKRFILAIERCTRVGWAVALCIVDYKLLFRKTWPHSDEGRAQRHQDYEDCHTKCAVRIREVLRRNGGIYIKMGQHLSAVQLIPSAWANAMKPLQDQCIATPIDKLEKMFLEEMGAPMSAYFSSFDEAPIGVASLAQVHVAKDRATGQKMAVKLMHPDLEEFSQVDLITTRIMLKAVKKVFPSFEFSWLGKEMEDNLPLEMDFRHEAGNAARCETDFKDVRSTSLYIPRVLWAKKRIMTMEFIEGARVDDLRYLAEHSIDRNRVAQELSEIFSRMIYVNGFFHADPHAGNLLIRPAKPNSRSPYNFEIALLDHGLYFDITDTLRVDYAHLWLSLIAPSTPQTEVERREYAFKCGNIEGDQYDLFQAAITGRAALDSTGNRGSMMDLQDTSKEETKKMRNSLVQEGLIPQVFDLLRRLPRRMIMVLKVNDLTRSLDTALNTTHGPTRVFLIVASYCNDAVYMDDRLKLSRRYRSSGFSFSLFGEWVSSWWRYQKWNVVIRVAESLADINAGLSKAGLWVQAWRHEGWKAAQESSAGLLSI